jgi:prophage regulatory protein
MTANIASPASRLCRCNEMQLLIGLSRSAIYDKLDPRSPRFDPSFPRPVKIGTRAVAWLESELVAWVDSCVESTRANAKRGVK